MVFATCDYMIYTRPGKTTSVHSLSSEPSLDDKLCFCMLSKIFQKLKIMYKQCQFKVGDLTSNPFAGRIAALKRDKSLKTHFEGKCTTETSSVQFQHFNVIMNLIQLNCSK